MAGLDNRDVHCAGA